MRLKVCIAGTRRGVAATIHRKLKRRNAVVAVLGRIKPDGRFARNFLVGIQGIAMNARISGARHNLRKIYKKLRLCCA